ncbi:MAG: arginine biosynthesis bifunctional protein ArgJ [Acidimicrobiia bacterium]|nr:MAG: arginine biosynthesis bifunctional protein ArgJ [Acidimicrobiia bacterium]
MSVVAPAGFVAGGVASGIKPEGLDLALIDAGAPVTTAAVFTTSRTAAPPVLLGKERVRRGALRAVLVNSGCANAGTGAAGLEDARKMAASAAAVLGCPEEEVLVSSTGPIGSRLPLDLIGAALPELVAGAGSTPAHGLACAEAIMTTDSVPKTAVRHGTGFTVGGVAKGAGMLRPDMATMLAYLTTDAQVPTAAHARRILADAVGVTFNCLNVDGCQSTNDTVVLMANGASGVSPDPEELAEAVLEVCRDLTWQLARDAEGATKVVTIDVVGAASHGDARRIALAVADSALVRSSFYGADPNWGRVLAAVGVAGPAVAAEDVDIDYLDVPVCRSGAGVPFDEDLLASLLGGDFGIRIRVGDGPGACQVITTDLTPDYVRFNGERS